MKVKIESSRIIKPYHDDQSMNPLQTTDYTPLSVFDKINYDTHVAIIYAYRPPTPKNSTIELGLQKALSVYREWAGRFGNDENGEPIILLNDKGVRFFEAFVDDTTLDQLMPLKPSPLLLNLHPNLHGVEELVQVQLTRFKCGSLVIGFTAHHLVGDGQSTSSFLVAWGQATRNVEINPIPFRDRTIFAPRNPPVFEFEHKGVEYMSKKFKKINYSDTNTIAEDIIVHKLHFSLEFLSKLKAKASQNGGNKPYTTFESLVAHLWRAITKARGLSGYVSTHVRISVNGRTRLNPKVPNNYFGNFVLWAFPTSKVKDLMNEPLPYAAKLIHEAVGKVNNNYFKSFIDYANYKAKEEELITTADAEKPILSPNIDVDSWLRFPFYDLDFGNGSPFIFLPSYLPIEGLIFLLPSYFGDGSIDVCVPLFKDNLDTFKKICYSLD